MKVKASEVKKGMSIGWGCVTITVVQQINESFQKNGKKLITFSGPGIRTKGRGYKPYKFDQTSVTAKSETLLLVK